MEQLSWGIIILCVGLIISTFGTFVAKDGWEKIHSKSISHQEKPHLLIQVREYPVKVVRDHINNQQVHTTQIFYQNNSPIPIEDCTFNIEVLAGTQKFDLSSLFNPKMYIGAGDARERNFVTKDEFLKRGFDVDQSAKKGEKIILSISYSFTYNNKVGRIKIQSYLWNSIQQKWDIE